jgi:hypothetical protein
MGVCNSINENNKNNNKNNNNNNNFNNNNNNNNNNQIEKNNNNNINNKINNNNNNNNNLNINFNNINNNISTITNLQKKFNTILEKNPFYSFDIQYQNNLINEFSSKNFLSPFQFIQNKNILNNNNNNNKIFLLLFEICYLKCDPILTNLFNDDNKNKNILFLTTFLQILSKNENLEKKNSIANSFYNLSYSQREKKINIEYLKILILTFSELCLEIILYLIIFPCLINKNNKNNNKKLFLILILILIFNIKIKKN